MKAEILRLIFSVCYLGRALVVLVWITEASVASAQTALPAPETSKIVAVRNVRVQDDVVSGEIANTSPRQVRDVQLLIRRIWHWNSEFRPGENPPGFADYYTLKEEIPAGETLRFTYRLPAESAIRPDGLFETVVTVAKFTEVIPQGPRGGPLG